MGNRALLKAVLLAAMAGTAALASPASPGAASLRHARGGAVAEGTWSGQFNSALSYAFSGSGNRCSVAWQGTLTVDVKGTGIVIGQGAASSAALPECTVSSPWTTNVASVTFSVIGKADGTGFHLHFLGPTACHASVCPGQSDRLGFFGTHFGATSTSASGPTFNLALNSSRAANGDATVTRRLTYSDGSGGTATARDVMALSLTSTPPTVTKAKQLSLVRLRATPARPHAGHTFTLRALVRGQGNRGLALTCPARLGNRPVRVLARAVRFPKVACTWSIPRANGRSPLSGALRVYSSGRLAAQKQFSVRLASAPR
jgi:hypothetical protein